MPTLVLRARQEIMPGFGFILPAAEAGRFAAAVPSARMAEIDANHYTIIPHDDSIAAIGAFRGRSWRPRGGVASATAGPAGLCGAVGSCLIRLDWAFATPAPACSLVVQVLLPETRKWQELLAWR
jgi:hypothetical protein